MTICVATQFIGISFVQEIGFFFGVGKIL